MSKEYTTRYWTPPPMPPGDAMKIKYTKQILKTLAVVLAAGVQDFGDVAKHLDRAYERLEQYGT